MIAGAPLQAGAEPARIGPNAIIRTVEALRERLGAPAAGEVLRAAELEQYVTALPAAMVSELNVIALYRSLRAQLDEQQANAVAHAAGLKTADYLLANRIPRPAQIVLRLLPARFASPLLLGSITRHTWTFAGSGTVSVIAGPPVRITIAGCPICRGATGKAPLCTYYTATFEGLFRTLVSARSTVREIACEASGAPACVFEIRS